MSDSFDRKSGIAEGTPEYSRLIENRHVVNKVRSCIILLIDNNPQAVRSIQTWCIAQEDHLHEALNWVDLWQSLNLTSPKAIDIVRKNCPSFNKFIEEQQSGAIVDLPSDIAEEEPSSDMLSSGRQETREQAQSVIPFPRPANTQTSIAPKSSPRPVRVSHPIYKVARNSGSAFPPDPSDPEINKIAK